jgi:TatD DNase family protein
MFRFIDTHAHLSKLSAETLAALFDADIGGIIDVGTNADDLSARISAFRAFDQVRFSAGIWPSAEAIAEPTAQMNLLEQQIAAAPPELLVAIGECGLDRRHNTEDANLVGERELLERHLQTAQRLNLPIIIHTREAFYETQEILARYPAVRGVIHCFSYDTAAARAFLDLGYFISFAGNLTYKSAQGLREALCFVPKDRLLLETDSPFLAPVPFRGKSATPAMIAETYKLAAELRKSTMQDLADAIRANSAALFAGIFSRSLQKSPENANLDQF